MAWFLAPDSASQKEDLEILVSSYPPHLPPVRPSPTLIQRLWDRMGVPLFLFTALLLAFRAMGSTPTGHVVQQKPNFVFIMTDDQDLHLNSLDYQKTVQQKLIKKGTTFKNHFCTVSLCCPSRVSLLTGRAAHNTNVTDVKAVSLAWRAMLN